MPITVLRLSDNSKFVINEAGPGTFVNSIKSNVRKNFYPKFPNGNLDYLYLLFFMRVIRHTIQYVCDWWQFEFIFKLKIIIEILKILFIKAFIMPIWADLSSVSVGISSVFESRCGTKIAVLVPVARIDPHNNFIE